MEYKSLDNPQLTLSEPGGPGLLHGYGATWGNWDRENEQMVKGATLPYLDAFIRDGFVSAYHNWKTIPVATIQTAHEDDHGLAFVAEFHSTPAAQDIRTTLQERLARGKSTKSSVGMLIHADEWVTREDTGTRGRLLKATEPFEIAVANVPINAQADILGVKSLPAGLTFADHFEWVRAACTEYEARMKGYLELRAKDGRMISAPNAARLQAMRDHAQAICDSMDELIAAAGPAPKAADLAALLDAGPAVAAFLHQHLIHTGVLPR